MVLQYCKLNEETYFKNISLSLCACVRTHMPHVGGIHGGKKRALDPLELKLQVVVGNSIWFLVTELGSSAKRVCALNH